MHPLHSGLSLIATSSWLAAYSASPCMVCAHLNDIICSLFLPSSKRDVLCWPHDIDSVFHKPVAADQRVSVDAPDFWTAAYSLRLDGGGQVACPAFLQRLAQGILSTGKSLILLRAHHGMNQRWGPYKAQHDPSMHSIAQRFQACAYICLLSESWVKKKWP